MYLLDIYLHVYFECIDLEGSWENATDGYHWVVSVYFYTSIF